MYASRPLDGHDLMFKTLRRLSSQHLVRFMLRHIRDSSRRGMCMREVISNALSGRSAAIASSVVVASCPHHLASKFCILTVRLELGVPIYKIAGVR